MSAGSLYLAIGQEDEAISFYRSKGMDRTATLIERYGSLDSVRERLGDRMADAWVNIIGQFAESEFGPHPIMLHSINTELSGRWLSVSDLLQESDFDDETLAGLYDAFGEFETASELSSRTANDRQTMELYEKAGIYDRAHEFALKVNDSKMAETYAKLHKLLGSDST